MGGILGALVAAAIAVLSGMGVGSGGLLVVYLTLGAGMEQAAAQMLNLFFFLFAAGASTAVNIRRRRIAWGCVALLGAGGVAGALIGTALAAAAEPRLLSILFGGMLTYTGAAGLFRTATAIVRSHAKGRGGK